MLGLKLSHISKRGHWNTVAAISQTIFSETFSWMKSLIFCISFHRSLYPRVQLTFTQYWDNILYGGITGVVWYSLKKSRNCVSPKTFLANKTRCATAAFRSKVWCMNEICILFQTVLLHTVLQVTIDRMHTTGTDYCVCFISYMYLIKRFI